MADIEITATQHGPYKITGDARLHDFDGRVVTTPSSEVYLCRCGLSANKPFCDGTHAAKDFDGSLEN